MAQNRPVSGGVMPTMSLKKVGGGQLAIGDADGWQLIVVYRGKHCPLCRTYLSDLNGQLDSFRELGIDVVVISADTGEKAETQARLEGWRFPVGFDLSIEQMGELGTFVSSPVSSGETDRPFSEPGLFVVNPDHTIQIVDISNSPGARPALPLLMQALTFTLKNNSKPRGTL